MTPGFKTTELATSLAVAGVGITGAFTTPDLSWQQTSVILGAFLLSGIYTISRTLAKRGKNSE